MMWLRYNTSTTNYSRKTNITLDRYSNGFTVKNAGNSVVVFNGDPLQPGQSKGIGGNYMEICTGRYSFDFQLPAVVPPGYVQSDLAVVTEKFYLPTPAQARQFNC